MGVLKGKNAGAQPVQQLEVICKTAEEGLTQMDMCLNKARNRSQRSGINNLAVERTKTNVLVPVQDPFNSVVTDQQGAVAHDAPGGIHRHNGPACDECPRHRSALAPHQSVESLFDRLHTLERDATPFAEVLQVVPREEDSLETEFAGLGNALFDLADGPDLAAKPYLSHDHGFGINRQVAK